MDLSRCCRSWLVHPNLAFHPAMERKSIFSNGKWDYEQRLATSNTVQTTALAQLQLVAFAGGLVSRFPVRPHLLFEP